jgi:hypothetical protein
MITNKRLLAAAAVVGMAMGSQSAMAQTADATATLIAPITVSTGNALVFGSIVRPASGSVTSIVSTGDARSGTALHSGGGQTAATLTAAGSGNLAYTPTITYATASTTGVTAASFVGKCGSNAEASFASGGTLSSCTLASTADTIKIGATLTVASTATLGANTAGTFTVTVAYN